MRASALRLLLSVLLGVIGCTGFQEGDFVPTARKAQFHEVCGHVVQAPAVLRRAWHTPLQTEPPLLLHVAETDAVARPAGAALPQVWC